MKTLLVLLLVFLGVACAAFLPPDAELDAVKVKPGEIRPTPEEIASKKFKLTYCVMRDMFYRNGREFERGIALLAFDAGIGVHLKREFDWEMAYLARAEIYKSGQVEWRFNLQGLGERIEEIEVNLKGMTTFGAGKLDASVIVNNETSFDLNDRIRHVADGDTERYGKNDGRLLISGPQVSDIERLDIRVLFPGGEAPPSQGPDLSWQHAQIFRTPFAESTDLNPDMEVVIRFK